MRLWNEVCEIQMNLFARCIVLRSILEKWILLTRTRNHIEIISARILPLFTSGWMHFHQCWRNRCLRIYAMRDWTIDIRRIFSAPLSHRIRLINRGGSGADSQERAFHDYCTTNLQRYSLPENRMFSRARVPSTRICRAMREMQMPNALLASRDPNALCKTELSATLVE